MIHSKLLKRAADRDTVCVERLWKSVNYKEAVCMYASVAGPRRSVGRATPTSSADRMLLRQPLSPRPLGAKSCKLEERLHGCQFGISGCS